MQLDPDETLRKVNFQTRLGPKEGGKRRPLLLKFDDVSTKDKVLSNSHHVRNSAVKLKPDMTKMERDEDSRFRASVDEENKNNPKDNSGDFRWQVAGPPGKLRKKKVRDIPLWEENQRKRAESRAPPPPPPRQ